MFLWRKIQVHINRHLMAIWQEQANRATWRWLSTYMYFFRMRQCWHEDLAENVLNVACSSGPRRETSGVTWQYKYVFVARWPNCSWASANNVPYLKYIYSTMTYNWMLLATPSKLLVMARYRANAGQHWPCISPKLTVCWRWFSHKRRGWRLNKSHSLWR